MKTISLVVSDFSRCTENSVLLDECNLKNKGVELYLLTNQQREFPTAQQCIEVHNDSEVRDVISELLSNMKTDYVMFIPDGFSFEYDDALFDALSLVDDNDVVCYATRYIGDTVNKFDNEYKNYVVNPSLSDIILYPSAYMTHIFSKRVYQSIVWRGHTMYEMIVNAFIDSILSGNKYAFTPLHVLSTKLKSIDVDIIIGKETHLNNFINKYPLFKHDYRYVLQKTIYKPTDQEIVIEKLQKTLLFRAVMSFRVFLKKLGFYDKKATIKYKKYLKQVRMEDELRKIDIASKIEQLPLNMLKRNNDDSDIIVSLTTHGKRLEDSAPYGIYSLFTQTMLPNRIVLNLNKDVWNNDNLPPLIKRLMQSGLEVIFCKDVRSHTKFLPALEKFPNNPIITVDDDMCYEQHMIEELVTAYHNSDKKTIFCRQGVLPKKKNGRYIPYMQWDDTINFLGVNVNGFKQYVSPYGVHGVIYPPHVFDNEIFRDDVFLNLAPHTDDIWFWLMEVRNNVKAYVVNGTRTNEDSSVSMIEYLEEAESTALYFQNCFNGRNDKEMYALLGYYNLK